MTRILPWLTGNSSTTIQRSRASAVKRQRQSDDAAESEPADRKRRAPNARLNRTPSSSPPALELPSQSPLRPGLKADDLYVTVEDEFLATAKTFTRHLHHAEYQRLRNLAKQRNVSTITSISRPTDSKTTMREELKVKKEAQARQAKTRKGVEDILARADQGGETKSDSDFEIHSDNEPWQGTQLQSFMSVSPKANLKSLVGLQGTTSHTRAAAGFPKSEKKTPTKSQRHSFMPEERVDRDIVQIDDDDTDDLDAPVRPSTIPVSALWVKEERGPTLPRTKPPEAPRPTAIKSSHIHAPKHSSRRSFLDMSPIASPPKAPPREPGASQHSSKPNKDPPLTGPSNQLSEAKVEELDSSIAMRAKLKARRERDLKEQEKETDEHSIPVFLV